VLDRNAVAEVVRRAEAVWADALFGGPWKEEKALAQSFVEFAREAAPDLHDEYVGLGNAAYCIELCLADDDTQDAVVTAFLLQLPDADAARAVRHILEHLPDMEEKLTPAQARIDGVMPDELDTDGLRVALEQCLSGTG
jgi:hypothetical protein